MSVKQVLPQEAPESKQQTAKPVVFTPADLIAGAASLGTTPEIMAGALYGVTKGITREEAVKRLETYLKKPVRAKKGV